MHIVIFENFVKSMTSCLSKLKVAPSFCFAFKIPDDVTASNPNNKILLSNWLVFNLHIFFTSWHEKKTKKTSKHLFSTIWIFWGHKKWIEILSYSKVQNKIENVFCMVYINHLLLAALLTYILIRPLIQKCIDNSCQNFCKVKLLLLSPFSFTANWYDLTL